MTFALFLAAAGCAAPGAACGAYDHPDGAVADAPASLATCSGPDDCILYLDPGPCGLVACDRIGDVGVPDVPGAPQGCYVRIDVGAACGAGLACDVYGHCVTN